MSFDLPVCVCTSSPSLCLCLSLSLSLSLFLPPPLHSLSPFLHKDVKPYLSPTLYLRTAPEARLQHGHDGLLLLIRHRIRQNCCRVTNLGRRRAAQPPKSERKLHSLAHGPETEVVILQCVTCDLAHLWYMVLSALSGLVQDLGSRMRDSKLLFTV